MCIFSGPVTDVGSTEIFVAALDETEHATVYRMNYQAGEPVAMVLPVPVRRGSGEHAVAFVDLSGYRTFFDDLRRCFPEPRPRGGGRGYGAHGGGQPPLVVHEVGDYVASFVPTVDDFDRLDPRFRLPEAAWDKLPDYSGFGFAVVQLQPGEKPKSVQPIAYRYPAERPHELYFPTTHLHDGGRVEARAQFDHTLYSQPLEMRPDFAGTTWVFGAAVPRLSVDLRRACGLVAPERRVGRLRIRGEFSNADVVLRLRTTPEAPLLRYPETEARLARVPWDLGPTMRWDLYERIGWLSGGYGLGRY